LSRRNRLSPPPLPPPSPVPSRLFLPWLALLPFCSFLIDLSRSSALAARDRYRGCFAADENLAPSLRCGSRRSVRRRYSLRISFPGDRVNLTFLRSLPLLHSTRKRRQAPYATCRVQLLPSSASPLLASTFSRARSSSSDRKCDTRGAISYGDGDSGGNGRAGGDGLHEFQSTFYLVHEPDSSACRIVIKWAAMARTIHTTVDERQYAIKLVRAHCSFVRVLHLPRTYTRANSALRRVSGSNRGRGRGLSKLMDHPRAKIPRFISQ